MHLQILLLSGVHKPQNMSSQSPGVSVEKNNICSLESSF
jgi:hypothetical protein